MAAGGAGGVARSVTVPVGVLRSGHPPGAVVAPTQAGRQGVRHRGGPDLNHGKTDSMIKAETKAITTAKPTILDIPTLNAVALRLDERADQIVLISLEELRLDLKLAARCAGMLAHVRFELGEIAEKTKDHDTRLEIRGLLDDASVAEPGVGEP